jgi:hypothetical protein
MLFSFSSSADESLERLMIAAGFSLRIRSSSSSLRFAAFKFWWGHQFAYPQAFLFSNGWISDYRSGLRNRAGFVREEGLMGLQPVQPLSLQ